MIIKVVIKGSCIGLIILGVISYASYLKTGVFILPQISNPFTSGNPLENLELSSKPVSIKPLPKPKQALYKWRSGGRWQYGDNPPKGVKASLVDPTTTQ